MKTERQYFELALDLAFNGSRYQRKVIKYYSMKGESNPYRVLENIKGFLDIQLELGMIDVIILERQGLL